MTRTSSIDDAVREVLRQWAVDAATPVAVGCSAGPDSTVLAHVVMRLSRHGDVGPVTLLYVDHGLRDGTANDAKLVRELARDGEASCAVLPAVVDRSRASLEDAARDARYEAIEAWSQAAQVPWVLLAHTASDQAETVLMRVLRGTGVVGLAAIPQRRARYLRPLLGLRRRDIEAYLSREQIDAREDPMNEDPAFFRVRVRRSLLPLLRAENPNVDEALCRLAASAREQREILDFAAERVLDDAAFGSGRAGWDVEALRAAPRAAAKRALFLATQRLNLPPPEARHLAMLLELVERPEAGTVTLDVPGGQAQRIYDRVWLVANGAPCAGRPSVSVSGPKPPYEVRTWCTGDRMRPERLKGRSRKLSDLFADAKVPAASRRAAIVVVRREDGEIVWAEGIGRAWQSQVDVSLTHPQAMASNKD